MGKLNSLVQDQRRFLSVASSGNHHRVQFVSGSKCCKSKLATQSTEQMCSSTTVIRNKVSTSITKQHQTTSNYSMVGWQCLDGQTYRILIWDDLAAATALKSPLLSTPSLAWFCCWLNRKPRKQTNKNQHDRVSYINQATWQHTSHRDSAGWNRKETNRKCQGSVLSALGDKVVFFEPHPSMLPKGSPKSKSQSFQLPR